MNWIGIWSLSGIRSKMAVIEKEDNTEQYQRDMEMKNIPSLFLICCIGFPTVRLPCSSLNPLLRSCFSLYGVRHIAELPSSAICKQACVTSVAVFTALGFLAVRLPCSSSNPLLRSCFSLYGVRHIAELPSSAICKQACRALVDNSYCMADY